MSARKTTASTTPTVSDVTTSSAFGNMESAGAATTRCEAIRPGLRFAVDLGGRCDNPRVVTEAEGTALLLARFTEAGFAIASNYRFHEGDIDVDLDGWDAAARVGYEYITREAGDDRQFDAATLALFEARMQHGELCVMLIDEHEAVTAEALDAAARGFLAEVKERRSATP